MSDCERLLLEALAERDRARQIVAELANEAERLRAWQDRVRRAEEQWWLECMNFPRDYEFSLHAAVVSEAQ